MTWGADFIYLNEKNQVRIINILSVQIFRIASLNYNVGSYMQFA